MAQFLCSVGLSTDTACNKTTLTKSEKVTNISELTTEDRRVLMYRVGVDFELETICAHHSFFFFKKYCELKSQRWCCDPFVPKRHNSKTFVAGNVVVKLHLSDAYFDLTKIRLIPGKRLCPKCSKDLNTLLQSHSNNVIESFECNEESPVKRLHQPVPSATYFTPEKEDFIAVSTFAINSAYSSLKRAKIVTPIINFQRMNADQKGAVILNQLDSFRRQLVMSDDASEITNDSSDLIISSTEDVRSFGRLLSNVRNKIHATENRNEIISLLTLMPDSWNISKIQKYINHRSVTRHTIEQAIKIREESGVLSKPSVRKGRCISEQQRQLIMDFFEDDENSRQMPGMKNVISVRQPDGTKKKYQKRLLLVNVDELHELFKRKYNATLLNNEKICGVSKFAMLRPRWVVCVGSSGTHSTCVCIYHQNVKLMLAAIGLDNEKHYLMDKLVCDTYQRKCMMDRCPECPGNDVLTEFIEELTPDQGLIQYRLWDQTDGTQLANRSDDRNDFISSLVKKINFLTRHHFVARVQATEFAQCKGGLFKYY